MKSFLVALGAVACVTAGAVNAAKQKGVSVALDDAVRFVNFVKSELRYRSADFGAIYEKGKAQKYSHIKFENGEIKLSLCSDDGFKNEFSDFINRIGTTDEAGQLALCDEYSKRFSDMLEKRRKNENEKIQVNTALSVFGALCLLIFFL